MLSGLILGAGGHGDGSINWIEIVAMTINFGILVYLVPKVVKALGPDGLAPTVQDLNVWAMRCPGPEDSGHRTIGQ